ncbi:MAG: hypothetical protein IMF06_05475 [Proteobacteria bacterium]|nr:hypothetical protein [Pseudomonadota bacterium]
MRRDVSLPIAALGDPRLFSRELRVLAALCYFDPEKKGVCTAKRNLIARIARVSESFVSRATKQLIILGWVGERIGNGGRQRPSTYQINWNYSPPLNGVREAHPLDAVNSAHAGHGLEAVNGVHETHPLTVNGVHETHPLTVNGVHETHPLEDKRCPRNTPFGGQTVSAKHTPNQIKRTDTNTDTNQIRSEGDTSSFGFDDVIEILFSYGTPKPFVKKEGDRKIIQKWLSSGVSAARITAACDRALLSKKDKKPFGPSYLDKVLDTMAAEEDKKREASDNFSDKNYATTSL